MDAVGHALITTGFSDDPLAIVASAINLRYTTYRLGQLRDAVPEQYSGFADGVWSHIVGNGIVNANPHFLEMKRQSREIISRNGIRDIFSEVAMEVSVDHLLLEDPAVFDMVSGLWAGFDWDKAAEYLPVFSREPERARRNIGYVRQRLAYLNEDYVSHWLAYVVKDLTGVEHRPEMYARAVEEITRALGKEKLYLTLLDEAQQEIRARRGAVQVG